MNRQFIIAERIRDLQNCKEPHTDILQLGTEVLYALIARKRGWLSAREPDRYKKLKKIWKKHLRQVWRDTLAELYHYVEPTRNQRQFAQTVRNRNVAIEVQVGNAVFRTLGLRGVIDRVIERSLDEEAREWQKLYEGDVIRFLNIREENIGSYLYLGEAFWARFFLKAVLFSIMFRAIFWKVYGKISPIVEWDSDRNPIYFDGKKAIGFDKTQFYLKLLSIGLTGVHIINDAGLDLTRIPTHEKINAVVFVPCIHDPELLRAEYYWRVKKRINLRVLYLSSFLEILRIWETEDVKRYLKQETMS